MNGLRPTRPAASSGSCRRGCCRRCGSTTGRRRARRRGGPASTRRMPTASMNVDLPAPGTPGDADAVGAAGVRQQAPSSSSSAAGAGGRRGVDSTSVIARPSVDAVAGPHPLDVAVDVHRRRAGRRRRLPAEHAVEQLGGGVGDHGSRREDRRRAGRAQGVEVLRRDDAADDHERCRRDRARRGRGAARARASGGRRRASTRRRRARRPRPPGGPPPRGSGTAGRRRRRSRGRRRRVAITFWPRSWPSWPTLATRIRGWRPSRRVNCSTRSRTRATPGPSPTSLRYTPLIVRIGAVCRPNTSSSAALISPTVARARAASIDSLSRLASGSSPRCRRRGAAPRRATPSRASSHAAWSRSARRVRSLAICSARTAELSTLSTSMSSAVSGRNTLTPTTGWRPESMRAWVRAAASSMRSLGSPASIALVIPPARSTSSMCAHARSRQVVGQPLDVVAAAPRIDDLARARLVLQQELGVAGDARREVGGQCQRLVEGVGVQRLGVALGRRHRLDAGAHDVGEHVLGGERPAGRLAVGAQRHRPRVARPERAHQLGPQQAGGAQLGHLHEEVHADGEEERQPRGEGVDRQPGGEPGRGGTRHRRRGCSRARGRRSPRPPACGSRRSRSS